jgi:hypothetical protein
MNFLKPALAVVCGCLVTSFAFPANARTIYFSAVVTKGGTAVGTALGALDNNNGTACLQFKDSIYKGMIDLTSLDRGRGIFHLENFYNMRNHKISNVEGSFNVSLTTDLRDRRVMNDSSRELLSGCIESGGLARIQRLGAERD